MRRLAGLATVGFLLALIARMALPVSAQQAGLDAAIAGQVAEALAGSRVAELELQTRGAALVDFYRTVVPMVPVVIGAGNMGSSVVIIAGQNSQAWVITNHHVVAKPFSKDGQAVVALMFYDPELKNEVFDYSRFLGCLQTPDATAWCHAVHRSTRLATVVRTDPGRDLALVRVSPAPSGLVGIPPANLAALQPGDDVIVIGHPKKLLWSLTTGIVSQVRTKVALGDGVGTVVQTQAPVNPGNSGGPLFGPDYKLAGVVFEQWIGTQVQSGTKVEAIPAPGLNLAIGIDEVLAFTNQAFTNKR